MRSLIYYRCIDTSNLYQPFAFIRVDIWQFVLLSSIRVCSRNALQLESIRVKRFWVSFALKGFLLNRLCIRKLRRQSHIVKSERIHIGC